MPCILHLELNHSEIISWSSSPMRTMISWPSSPMRTMVTRKRPPPMPAPTIASIDSSRTRSDHGEDYGGIILYSTPQKDQVWGSTCGVDPVAIRMVKRKILITNLNLKKEIITIWSRLTRGCDIGSHTCRWFWPKRARLFGGGRQYFLEEERKYFWRSVKLAEEIQGFLED